MNLYCDISTACEPEDINFLINLVLQRIHGVLSSNAVSVGVSFPNLTKRTVGDIIRLQGNRESIGCVLEELILPPFMVAGDINEIPLSATPCSFIAIKSGGSGAKQRRRSRRNPKLNDKTERQVIKRKGPYISLRSKSTGKQFSRWIKKEVSESFVSGTFDAYGFSTRTDAGKYTTVMEW